MLLLVLILVVIAFGLLVVALLSGSVLWAWVSVGVSVIAAVVLLVDWLQRRAAVKAGAAPAVEPAAGAPAPLAGAPMGLQPGMGRPPMADLDPATEVLPIVPSSPRGDDETVVAQAPKKPEARPADAQQTVVMPAVQPSGSPARPSGAEAPLTSSSAISSPTVTGEDVDRSDPGFGSGDATSSSGTSTGVAAGAAAAAAVAAGLKGDAEKATSVESASPAEKAPSSEKPPSLIKDGAEPAEKVEDVAPEAEVSPAQVESTPSAAANGSGPAASEATVVGTPPPSGPDAESTVKVEAHTKAPVEPAVAVKPDEVDLFGAAPVRQQAEQPPAEQAPVEHASIDEAPEEPRDPVAAETVSRLDDEVVVVDEQPRYHVTECRALVSVAVIPLPVREAVELGFTPCGWCSPDRTLAGRHQTASR